MVTKRNSRKSRRIGPAVLGKPNGIIQPRVQAVGPQRFGVVAVDCAKARSKWMLCDFYGKVLLPPTVVEHQRAALQAATLQLQEACKRHGLGDHIVAVEMTGTYHRPVQRAFRRAGSETRLVHPFASRHYRVPAHADNKTDDHDLEGIFRAAVNGFGLLEPVWAETYLRLQLLARHRRDLVDKRAKLQCQIRQYLERCLPGYAALFPGDDLWAHAAPMTIARCGGSAEAIGKAGVAGMRRWLDDAGVRAQSRTIDRVGAWAANAAEADPLLAPLTDVWRALEDDWLAKTRQIDGVERELAEILVQTPYVLLLSHPGIGVVSAADLAGEMGPIEHYAHAKAITGRAGLFPSRYQSDQVDRPDGPLTRHCNTRLRAAWLRVADNLIKCNAHFHGKFQLWKQRGVDGRDIRCRVANRAARTVFQMVSGRKLYHHPSRLDRAYVLDKLLAFHRKHDSPPHKILRDLRQAADQIPRNEQAAEAVPLKRIYQRTRRSRRPGPRAIGEILVTVLARLGVDGVQSETEAPSLDANVSETSIR
jgi:transposase